MAERFRPSRDALATRVGDEIVLVHLKTDKIFVLNRTAARVWELVCADCDVAEIQSRMREEFDVAEGDVTTQVRELLGTLRDDDLVTADEGAEPFTP